MPVETLSVPDCGDVAAAIVEHVRTREGALLVMCTGGAYLVSQARRSIASDVLERLCQPVLLLGPHCSQQMGASALVVGVDQMRERQPAMSSWPPESSGEIIDASLGATVLRTNDAAAALVALGETIDDAVFVLTSDRWPGGRSHWYSTTRRVVQTTTRPVLVVPSDLPS